MNTAYFSKVSHSMSWNKLKANIVEQKKHGVKPLPYIIISKLYISSSDHSDNKPTDLVFRYCSQCPAVSGHTVIIT